MTDGDASPDDQSHAPDDDSVADLLPPAVAPNSKRRTKTGCMTCRKRRIKCGEERPSCTNCLKSKRHCEGYNPRPHYRLNAPGLRHLHNGPVPVLLPTEGFGTQSFTMADQPHPQHIQIRPDIATNAAHVPPGPHSAPLWQTPPWPGLHPLQSPTTPQPATSDYAHHLAHPFPAVPSPDHTLAGGPPIVDQHGYALPIHAVSMFGPAYNSGPQSVIEQRPPLLTTPDFSPSWSNDPVAHHVDQVNPGVFSGHNLLPRSYQSPISDAYQASTPSLGSKVRAVPTPPIPHPQLGSGSSLPLLSQGFDSAATGSTADFRMHSKDTDVQLLLNDAAIKHFDVEYDQPQSSASIRDEGAAGPASKFNQQVLMQIYQKARLALTDGASPSSGVSGVLDTYRPEYVANPLKSSATAQVFSHFVHQTAPHLSAHARTPLPEFRNLPASELPFSQRGLWTHSIPSAALNDQGLLQALLAVASLHMAKITNSSTTPSYKHYAYALKWVRRAVTEKDQRHKINVLAASMLLSIHELWCVEHVTWNRHLAGAAHLLKDADFPASQRQVNELRMERDKQIVQGYLEFHVALETGHFPDHLQHRMKQFKDLDQIPEIDARLVSVLSGTTVRYDNHGHIRSESPSSNLHNLDLEALEVQKDLFWAFCRHDIVGCAVSGNPLLLPYARWIDFPPRGPINMPGSTMGAHDHIMLVLGRIVDFAARDRPRKVLVMRSESSRHAQVRVDSASSVPLEKAPPQAMPTFYGLAPPAPARGPPSYYGDASASQQDSLEDELRQENLDELTEKALAEWADTVMALETLISLLGPQYRPVTVAAPPMTPFGPAEIYQHPFYAGIWSHIHFAWILLHRAHPSLLPYAYAAVGMSAHTTKTHVDKIGRIAGGLVPLNNDNQQTTPDQRAVMLDLCLALFVAGVQVADPVQREFVVSVLYEVQHRCAHDTAGVIVMACQKAWHKAGLAGRGPPYRVRDTKAEIESAAARASGERFQLLGPRLGQLAQKMGRLRASEGDLEVPSKRLFQAMGLLETGQEGLE